MDLGSSGSLYKDKSSFFSRIIRSFSLIKRGFIGNVFNLLYLNLNKEKLLFFILIVKFIVGYNLL